MKRLMRVYGKKSSEFLFLTSMSIDYRQLIDSKIMMIKIILNKQRRLHLRE